MHHPCQFVQSYGHLRSNDRANITITQDTISCVRLHINTPAHAGLNTQIVIAGRDLYAFHAALGKIVAQAKRREKEADAATTPEERYRLTSRPWVGSDGASA
jgi:hypothetical protein